MWLNGKDRLLKATSAFLLLYLCCCQALFAGDIPKHAEEPPLIVELFFADRSVGIHRVHQHQNDFWFPFELFQQHAQIPIFSGENNKVKLLTSLGPIEFYPESLNKFDGIPYVSYTTLKNSLHIHTLFNKSIHAIKFIIPWQPLSPENGIRNKNTPKPDLRAPESSLSFLHFESDMTHTFPGKTHSYLELEAGGRIASGTWDIMWQGDPAERFSPSRYHWTTLNRYSALRIGTGTSQIYPLLNNLGYTGAQFAWNNQGIMQNLDNNRYIDTDVLLNIDRTQRRTIEGAGPPGGIAELRFDGYVVTRQRIPFNGRFIFRNVRMTSDLRITEVYLYERTLLEKPLQIINYSQSLANRSLANGEILFHGAVGSSGNVLAGDAFPTSVTGFGHLLYGLNKDVTFESALQHNRQSNSIDALFGPVLSIGSHWNAAIYGARSNGRFGADASIYGHGKTWRVTHRSLWEQKGFGYDTNERHERHAIRLQAKPFSWLNTFVYGKFIKKGNSIQSRYLLPGGTMHLSPRARFTAIPDDENGDYRYEAYLSPRYDMDVRFRYENEVITTDMDYDFRNSNNMLQFIHSFETRNASHASSIYYNWYPAKKSNNHIQLGASYSPNGFGFSGSWSKAVNAGLHFILAYNDNMYHASGLSVDDNTLLPDDINHKAVSLYLSWDLGRSNSRFYPINRTAISHTRGGMAGSLKVMTGSGVPQSSINDVAILINGRRLGQRQAGGNFFIGNLKPGIYSVSVDPENLPLELVVERQNIKVEVRSGSVTEVTIPVYAEYGAAGKVCTLSEHMLAGVEVKIIDSEGKTIKQTQTDQFGYYRVDGLRQGTYTARATTSTPDREGSLCETEFTITNNFLFDIDIVIPEETRPKKPSNALQADLP